MDETPIITIDMDRKCSECGRKGAAQNGLCLNCITKRIGQITRKRREASMGSDEFLIEGMITDAHVKVGFTKAGQRLRSLVLKVVVPEPLGLSPEAFDAGAKDVIALSGKQLVVRGQTVQVELPLEKPGPLNR
jgi:hypothetical protein